MGKQKQAIELKPNLSYTFYTVLCIWAVFNPFECVPVKPPCA